MQKTAEESAGQGRRAVLALLGSAFMFSLMTLGVKRLGARLPVAELVLARSIVGLSISLAMARLIGINPWGRRRGLLALRGLLGTMALGCIFAALKRLPLAEATGLQFLYPTLTAALAWILLGESPSRRGLAALPAGPGTAGGAGAATGDLAAVPSRAGHRPLRPPAGGGPGGRGPPAPGAAVRGGQGRAGCGAQLGELLLRGLASQGETAAGGR